MHNNRNIFLRLFIIVTFLFVTISVSAQKGTTINREAKNSITPVKMDIGDTLKFKLRNGEMRTMVLEGTDVGVVITNLGKLKKSQSNGGLLYYFTCDISIDGHSMTMKRYVGSQESFYEPYVINGMRIWFDGISKITEMVEDNHVGHVSGAVPLKAARFAVADMQDYICPVELFPIYDNKDNYIDISNSYNGDDCWLGAFNGIALHNGLDLNKFAGDYSFTPFPMDDHYLFNSLANGDNNNRWRGIRKWDNGDTWMLQEHHLLSLLVPEHTPIEKGVRYAECCGVHIGSHTHRHYVFKIQTPEDKGEFQLDPWILFWQIFNDNSKRNNEIKSIIAPFHPGKTGVPIQFFGDSSRRGLDNKKLSYYWTFGDGGFSIEENPTYTFIKPGIYPVTLVVDNGAKKSTFTQDITVDGEKIDQPNFVISSEDVPSFRMRSLVVMDTYGEPVKSIPHTLHFLARPTRTRPEEKVLEPKNNGSGILAKVSISKISYSRGKDWLTVKAEGKGNDQKLHVSVDGTDLATGMYTAEVRVESPGSANSIQYFNVELLIPTYPPTSPEMRNTKRKIIDNMNARYNQFYSTPYFWIGPRFKRWDEKGFNDFYLTNGGNDSSGEYARFRPDLASGKYEISFVKKTPFDPQRRAMKNGKKQLVNEKFNPIPRFKVRVHSKAGDTTIWVAPTESKIIGQFEFYEGMDGYVDILSEGSTGQVLVDAIVFKRID